MPRLLHTTALAAALLLAGTVHAQTTIDLGTTSNPCSYTTPAPTQTNPNNISLDKISGHLVATSGGSFSGSGCPSGTSLTFGPASDLAPASTSLAGGTGVPAAFTFEPFNASSCTVAITRTSGTGTFTPATGTTVCNSTAACTPLVTIPATFTNTSTTTASNYTVAVTCAAVAGASPAAAISKSVAVTQAAMSSGGTPTANFTFTTSGLTANFTDASTDSGGTINAWSWNFGDSTTSTQKNPSHTYATAGSYSVTETVTDSGAGQATSSKTQSVTVSVGGSCATIASSTAGIANFTQWTGNQTVHYYGVGDRTVDVTNYASVWSGPWPSGYGSQPLFTLPNNKYMSQVFTVPSNYFTAPNVPTNLVGEYTIGTTGRTSKIAMTISRTCGDFSQSTAPGSTVVSGCYLNNGVASSYLMWTNTDRCVLTGGQTYYLNLINADISTLTPGGGTAASTKNTNCGASSCNDPLIMQGNFNNYVPQ